MRLFNKEVQSDEPLSAREFRRFVERKTREYFNMNVPEFRAALRAGQLDQNLAASDIALLLGETPR